MRCLLGIQKDIFQASELVEMELCMSSVFIAMSLQCDEQGDTSKQERMQRQAPRESAVLKAWEKKERQKELSRNMQWSRQKTMSTMSGKPDEDRNHGSNSSPARNTPTPSASNALAPSHCAGAPSPLPLCLGTQTTLGVPIQQRLEVDLHGCLISCIPGIFHDKNML